MTKTISQRELRNDSGRIMRSLDDGATFIVTRRGEPVGELKPLRRRRYVDARTVTDIFRGSPHVDAARWRRDLDHCVDQNVNPRG